MRIRRFASLLCVAACLISFCFCVSALGITDKVGNAFCGGDVQAFLDSRVNCEFFAIAEYKRGSECDFTPFCSFLKETMEAKEEPVLSRMRMALAYTVITGDTSFANALIAEAKDEKRLMSLVFALHMINVGGACDGVTSEYFINELISKRLDDGGWAVTGKYADVDVTAMVLQAFAPYKDDYSDVIDGALELLSKKQQPDGDYLSYGITNPESTAQVIIALTSLGIDALHDGRFIKDGKTLLDGVSKYVLDDGNVCHTFGGAPNANATYQTFCALVALELFENGEPGLYMPTETNGDVENDVPVVESPPEAMPTESQAPVLPSSDVMSEAEEVEESHIGIRIPIVIFLSVGLLAAVVIMIVRKKRIVDVVIVLAVGLALIACVCFINIEGFDSATDNSEISKQNIIGSVTISISCDAIDTVFLPEREVVISDGETVYDILSQVAKHSGIVLSVTKNIGSVYVSAIGGVGEFDFGDGSGWKYSVNGEVPMIDASSYILSDGDVVEWFYVIDG